MGQKLAIQSLFHVSLWMSPKKEFDPQWVEISSEVEFLFLCPSVFTSLILLLCITYLDILWKRRCIKQEGLLKFNAYFHSWYMSRKGNLNCLNGKIERMLWILITFTYIPLQIPFFMWCKLLNTLYTVLYYIFEVCMMIPRWFFWIWFHCPTTK